MRVFLQQSSGRKKNTTEKKEIDFFLYNTQYNFIFLMEDLIVHFANNKIILICCERFEMAKTVCVVIRLGGRVE